VISPDIIISFVRFCKWFSFVVTSLVAKDNADPKQSNWFISRIILYGIDW